MKVNNLGNDKFSKNDDYVGLKKIDNLELELKKLLNHVNNLKRAVYEMGQFLAMQHQE